MRKRIYILSIAVLTLIAGSCNRYNPFDSYYHGGVQREDTGGKPGKGGLFADGFGTEESPYGLSTPQHMQNIPRGLVEGEMIYFKMLNDIDLTGISWTALNPTDPYKKFIDFDGDGHVITNLYCPKQSYGGFFGVLCGYCHDVGFLNAYVESSNSGGVLGGYVGLASPSSGDFTGRVERVYVTGTVRASNAGAICGDLGKIADGSPCTIKDCYSIVEVNGSANTGGLVGNMRSGSKIENSYALGPVFGGTGDNNGTGGIAGYVNGGTITGSIGWNESLSGSPARGGIYGVKEAGTVSESYILSTLGGANVSNEGTTLKTKTELQAVASAWGDGWFSNGAISNGYPILIWQQERGDYGEYSGHGEAGEGGGDEYTPGFKGGTGTENDPYLIEKLVHLRSMHDFLGSGEEKWFKMVADVDARALSNWTPLNTEDPYDKKVHFDGDGHKISNLRSTNETYAGFFGVLYGECKRVTFDKCTVSQSKGSACGILGGYAGTGSKQAVIDNVTFTNCSVSSSGAQPCGGMFGIAANAVFTGCSVDAAVESSSANTESKNQGFGGYCGQVKGTVSFTDCSFSGSVKGGRLVGGIAGYVNTAATITACSNSGEITAYQITSNIDGARAGGIAGHIDAGTLVEKCSNSGAITAAKQAGGIIGWVESNNNETVIRRCFSTGNIKSSQWSGGIAGYVASGDIYDCWSSGTISLNSGGQMAAGIAAEVKSGYLSSTYPSTKGKIVNCWSKASLSGARVLGGIAGRCAHDGWNATATDSQKVSDITITGCIAWNPSIQSPNTGQDQGSSGAIVGYSYIKNNLSNCWRSPSMNFVTYADNVLTDMEDVSPTAPLSKTGVGANCYPYHGKAASSMATVTSVAISLGWDEDVWDLSGSEPVLK